MHYAEGREFLGLPPSMKRFTVLPTTKTRPPPPLLHHHHLLVRQSASAAHHDSSLSYAYANSAFNYSSKDRSKVGEPIVPFEAKTWNWIR
ncbi:hypothetical protein L2E82_48981 [Cichorium intybus]|uniref:Uncharacterized protein n=1 Tax=Cichorium intybus TaxID=13427 RepID=A0ACB8Z0P3_CICIN|nr:hypothetical protein L2E82_48981 [Cichorium intybus]